MSVIRNKLITVAGAGLLLAWAAPAQNRPNFTGTWKMDSAKSTFGTSTPIPQLTLKVRHSEPEFLVTHVFADGTEDFKAAIDGKEYANNLRGGVYKTKIAWQGSTLKLATTLETPGGTVSLDDSFILSADNKVLNISRKLTTPNGETNWAMHFDKQADAPDLSGTWKAAIPKSAFGPFPAPESMTVKIEQKEASVKMSTTMVGERGEFTMDFTLKTDGGESVNQMGSVDVKSKAKWEGGVLLVDSKASGERGEMTSKEKWTLAPDGKTLTLVRQWSSSMGEATQNVVFEK